MKEDTLWSLQSFFLLPFNILLSIWDSPQFPSFQYFDSFSTQCLCIKDFFNLTIAAFTQQVSHDILANEFTLIFFRFVDDLLRAYPMNERHEPIIFQVEWIINFLNLLSYPMTLCPGK